MSYRLKTIVEADTATPSTVFTPTVINVGDIAVSDFNSNENTSNCCSTLFINRSGVLPTPPPSPPPTLTPTPSITPTVTPTTPIPLPSYNTGEIMYTLGSSQFQALQNFSMWFNNIQRSNSPVCPTMVAGLNPWKMMQFQIIDYANPPSADQYDHYSYNMVYLKPQIEPTNFGSRKCFVFSAEPSVGGVFGGYRDLCFHYFSQNFRPDLAVCAGYPRLITKMAPNSGTFGDGKTSRQRTEIQTNVGSYCLLDFYIKPEDNSYHVVYTSKQDTAAPDNTSNVYTYYTKSTNRGSTWSQRSQIGNEFTVPNMHSWYPCKVGGYVVNGCDPAITNKKGINDKPAALYMEQNGNAYDVVCSYSYSSLFDRKRILASGYLTANQAPQINASRLDFDPQFAHFKILYDNANRLITLWTGTAGPDGSMDGYNYTGQGRSRIVYRYLSDENNNTWSPLVTACRTFPHGNIKPSTDFIDAGRYWDACIDDTDNTLCILYTPDPSNSGGYSFSAFVAKVMKINIITGQTIYDETALDITSSPLAVSTIPKGIGGVGLYYDSQLNKLVMQCYTRNIQGSDGKLFRMQRNSTNNWSEIPVLGASGGLTPLMNINFAHSFFTIQRNLRT